jgi:tetratricopeptide (TPR) repeat protein
MLFAGPVLAMGGGNTPPPPTAAQLYKNGESAIYAQQWDRGISLMKQVVAKEPKNVDANNYLGFAYRKKGDLKNAASFYKVALRLNPKHKGALEYQGEMFLKLGELAAAQNNQAMLKGLCPSGCKELNELTRAIADFTASKGRQSGS